MPSFSELLTANDTELVKYFYKVNPTSNDDFIIRINKIATSLGLNHTQLICALAFNAQIEDMTDVQSILGFRSYKVLAYRNEELFVNDVYYQLTVDNILDLYSVRLEDTVFIDKLRGLIPRRLQNIEERLSEGEDPTLLMCYKMEMSAIYHMGIADQAFAEKRIDLNNSHHRLNSDELKLMVETALIPKNNLFFLDNLSAEEKAYLVKETNIEADIIRNRLDNTLISMKEREVLEGLLPTTDDSGES